MEFVIRTDTADQTRKVGRMLGGLMKPGDVISLVGELGAGKTTFVQGIAEGLGIHEHVTSPTFTLINEYQGRIPLYHFDAYRLTGVEDFEDLGVDDYFTGNGVSVIEWGDRVEAALPSERLDIILDWDNTGRKLTFKPSGTRYEKLTTELQANAGVGD